MTVVFALLATLVVLAVVLGWASFMYYVGTVTERIPDWVLVPLTALPITAVLFASFYFGVQVIL